MKHSLRAFSLIKVSTKSGEVHKRSFAHSAMRVDHITPLLARDMVKAAHRRYSNRVSRWKVLSCEFRRTPDGTCNRAAKILSSVGRRGLFEHRKYFQIQTIAMLQEASVEDRLQRPLHALNSQQLALVAWVQSVRSRRESSRRKQAQQADPSSPTQSFHQALWYQSIDDYLRQHQLRSSAATHQA
jgi:hypothetical protein